MHIGIMIVIIKSFLREHGEELSEPTVAENFMKCLALAEQQQNEEVLEFLDYIDHKPELKSAMFRPQED